MELISKWKERRKVDSEQAPEEEEQARNASPRGTLAEKRACLAGIWDMIMAAYEARLAAAMEGEELVESDFRSFLDGGSVAGDPRARTGFELRPVRVRAVPLVQQSPTYAAGTEKRWLFRKYSTTPI